MPTAINLVDKLLLLTTGRYPSPRDSNAYLPIVYGDMTENSEDRGLWTAPMISTSTYTYCFAGHAVQSVADGNVIRAFDRDGIELTDFTFNHNNPYLGLSSIATLVFASDVGDITVQGKGKTDDAGVLIDNPLDILTDILNNASNINSTTFSQCRLDAEAAGYTAAGVILQEASYLQWMNAIAASFLMDVYTSGDGRITAKIDTGQSRSVKPVGYLRQREATSISATQSIANLCNQVIVNYAVSYESDKRFKEGARSNYIKTDDGDDSKDIFSQNKYGVRTKTFDLDWTRNTVTVNAIQARIIAQYAAPKWIYNWSEMTMQAMQVEKGDYVAFSWEERRDSDGNPLVNQIAKVIEKECDLDMGNLTFRMISTPYYLTEEPVVWDGSYNTGDGGTFGAERSTGAF